MTAVEDPPPLELDTLSSSFAWRLPEIRWPLVTPVGPGLEGVVAAATEVTWLDPSSGALCYRGIPIEELATGGDFEAVAYLLLSGREAAEQERDYAHFCGLLRSSRELPAEVLELLAEMPDRTHPTRVLRAGVSALGCHEMRAGDELSGERHWRELRIVGQLCALLGAVCARRRGAVYEPPSASVSLAAGVLEALNGRAPTAAEERALNLLWILYAAHGMDSPTFTSMIVASCLADPYTNVVAGLSAMRGRRQGGAGEAVLEQLLSLPDEDQARAWVRTHLASGGRIAGFGHRLYRMPDPRVVILRKETAALARARGLQRLFTVARSVEEEATRELTGRGVHVNINFYAALMFHLLGADGPLIPCLFAAGRMAGLVALVRESLARIRLFRPLSHYVGVPFRSLETRRKS